MNTISHSRKMSLSSLLEKASDFQTPILGKKEEHKMNEAFIVIVLAAFLFGMIMGLALGKANK